MEKNDNQQVHQDTSLGDLKLSEAALRKLARTRAFAKECDERQQQREIAFKRMEDEKVQKEQESQEQIKRMIVEHTMSVRLCDSYTQSGNCKFPFCVFQHCKIAHNNFINHCAQSSEDFVHDLVLQNTIEQNLIVRRNLTVHTPPSHDFVTGLEAPSDDED
jgi:hypothetical protein